MLFRVGLTFNTVGVGGSIGGAGDGVNYEVNDGKGKDGDNKTDNSIEDGVFSISDLFAIATRDNIAEATVDKHNNRNDTDDVEDGISNLSENAIWANKIIRHTIGTSDLGAFLDSEGRCVSCDRHQNSTAKA